MAASDTTLAIIDGAAASKTARVVDEGDATLRNAIVAGGITATALSDDTLKADIIAAHNVLDLDRALVTRAQSPLGDKINGTASNTDGTSTAVIAAQTTGIKVYLTDVIIVNAHATTEVLVEIKDGSTTKLVVFCPAKDMRVVHLETPIAGTAATAWNFDPGAAVTTVYCTAVGFKSKV